MWVFKTCARVRGAQRTLNQLRTTSRKKTAWGIPVHGGNRTLEDSFQSYFSSPVDHYY